MPVTGTSKSIGTSTEKTTELVKSMEEMSIQAIELKKLREKVSILETNCKLHRYNRKKKLRRIKEWEKG